MEEGRDPVSQLKPLSKCIFVLYERRASSPWLDLAIEILPTRAGNFPYTCIYVYMYCKHI